MFLEVIFLLTASGEEIVYIPVTKVLLIFLDTPLVRASTTACILADIEQKLFVQLASVLLRVFIINEHFFIFLTYSV